MNILGFRLYRGQKRFLGYLKSGRRIHIIHWFRQYSALSVVVSSVFVVTGTNLSASHGSTGIVSGYFHEQSVGTERVERSPFMAASMEKDNLSFAPLASASAKVDPVAKDEALSPVVSADQLAVSAQQSPVLKDPEENGGVAIYTVVSGDTVGSIAEKHHITVNTILWANDLENADSIRPGDQIFILPVAGLSYTVKDGDSIESIAKKFSADKDRILAFNSLPANGQLKSGDEIIIPDGRKEVERTTLPNIERRQYATSGDSGLATDISGKSVFDGKAGGGHKFPYGYCTWYVAQKRFVPWGGNAGTWLYNAKAQGYSTGKAPRKGAIVVTTESAYYGHVAIVESVGNGTITVSEMNYVAWGKVNKRTLSTSSRAIKGYIY